MSVCYNNNNHTMLEVNALLKSPMQGLHSESLWMWMGMLCWATLRSDTYISHQLPGLLSIYLAGEDKSTKHVPATTESTI